MMKMIEIGQITPISKYNKKIIIPNLKNISSLDMKDCNNRLEGWDSLRPDKASPTSAEVEIQAGILQKT